MHQAKISIIAAISRETRAIGKDNKLLWDIPADLKRFREITSGHPIIMGRTTFESIGRPLPNRTNIVVTRNKNFTAEGCVISHSLFEAIGVAQSYDSEEVFIIGGAQIYEQALSLAEKLYLTTVDASLSADTFFPNYSNLFNKVIFEEKHSGPPYSYTFLELEK